MASEEMGNETYLSEFWHIDETSQILQVGAFVVEFPEVVMLRTVSTT